MIFLFSGIVLKNFILNGLSYFRLFSFFVLRFDLLLSLGIETSDPLEVVAWTVRVFSHLLKRLEFGRELLRASCSFLVHLKT